MRAPIEAALDAASHRRTRRVLASALLWAPPACLAMAAFGEHLANSKQGRSLALPSGEWLARKLVIDIPDFGQALSGYLIMLAASLALAVSLRKHWPGNRAFEAPTSGAATLSLPWRSRGFAVATLAPLGLWLALAVASTRRDYHWFFPILLLAAVAIAGVGLYRHDRRRNVCFHLRVHGTEIVALGTVLLLAGLVLSYDLTMTPDSFWPDEGSFWDGVRSIGGGHQRVDFFAPGVYGFPLASSIYQTSFAKVFGYSVFAWRFSSVFATLLACVPFYFLTRALFDRRVAFGALILLTGSPILIAFARLGYNNSQSFLPVICCLLATVVAIERRSALLFFVAGLAAGLGFYTYFADRFVVVMIPILLLWAGSTGRLRWREAGVALALAAAGTILVGSFPSIRTFAEHSDYLNRKSVEAFWANSFYVQAVYRNAPVDTFPTLQVGEVKLVFDLDVWVRLLSRGLIRTLLAFHRDDAIFHHYIKGSLGGPVTSVLLLPGVTMAALNLRRVGGVLTFAWFATALLLLGVVSAFPPAQAHLVPMIPLIALLYAVVLVAFADWLASTHLPIGNIGASAVLAVAVLILAGIGVRHYFEITRHDFPPSSVQAVVAFRAMEAGGGIVSFVYRDPRFATEVPWEVSSFGLDAHYQPVAATELDESRSREQLVRSASIVVEGPDIALLHEVSALVPGWQPTTYVAGRTTVAWVLKPPR